MTNGIVITCNQYSSGLKFDCVFLFSRKSSHIISTDAHFQFAISIQVGHFLPNDIDEFFSRHLGLANYPLRKCLFKTLGPIYHRNFFVFHRSVTTLTMPARSRGTLWPPPSPPLVVAALVVLFFAGHLEALGDTSRGKTFPTTQQTRKNDPQ